MILALFKHLPQRPEMSGPSHTPTAWDDIDETSRAAALAILARLIAKMLSAGQTKGANNE
jgi:hypothetical protein